MQIQGQTHYFSNEAQKQTQENAVFDNPEDVVDAMFTSTALKMLVYGGNCLKGHEINLGGMLPIQFSFGSGGPTLGKRNIDVSNASYIHHYIKLSLNQLMQPDFILVHY